MTPAASASHRAVTPASRAPERGAAGGLGGYALAGRSHARIGPNIHRAPIAEEGTRECREATSVINQLQQNIRAQLAELRFAATG
jgi:hypothetical protein